MIAFFDTNIYIDYLKGLFPSEVYDSFFREYIIRVCPVVYQELIRGIRTESVRKKVEKALHPLVFLPPPSNAMWIQAGELASRVMGNKEERSLEKIQNDLLIALTARTNGATLITQDHHFLKIKKEIDFKLLFFKNKLN